MNTPDLYYIYAIRTSEAVKVGFSKKPRSRKRAIQTGNVQQVNLAWLSAPLKSIASAKGKERHFHKKLRKYHIRGEWFDLEALGWLQAQGKKVGLSFPLPWMEKYDIENLE